MFVICLHGKIAFAFHLRLLLLHCLQAVLGIHQNGLCPNMPRTTNQVIAATFDCLAQQNCKRGLTAMRCPHGVAGQLDVIAMTRLESLRNHAVCVYTDPKMARSQPYVHCDARPLSGVGKLAGMMCRHCYGQLDVHSSCSSVCSSLWYSMCAVAGVCMVSRKLLSIAACIRRIC